MIVFIVLIIYLCSWMIKKPDDKSVDVIVVKKDLTDYKAMGKSAGTKSEYTIDLKMDEAGNITVQANINITNTSEEDWSEVQLYFIPNMFTKESSPLLEKPATVEIDSVKLNDVSVKHSLIGDTLAIPLNEPILPNGQTDVEVEYRFTMPEKGWRFTTYKNNYYLAQWYPMVPTYRNGWNKEEYIPNAGETYHTTHSNFKLNYEIPDNFTFVSSYQNDTFPSKNKDSIYIENVKEVFIGILKEPIVSSMQVRNTEIRVFGFESKTEARNVALLAEKALTYFQKNLGPYPYKQLDIIVNDTGEYQGMEYPGVVTVSSPLVQLNRTVVHEIAHQWFYGIINNDPYYDAWLDEGITTFATALFQSKEEGNELKLSLLANMEPYHSNLPLNQYPSDTRSYYIYYQSAYRLWEIFKQHGGVEQAELFLQDYYSLYKFKEVDTKEFVSFLKFELDLQDDSLLKNWLTLEESTQ
ncbi:M1 family peptidase [Paenibacillus anaericanus]|uniref:M1 family peptidase n=2 Tax=Paenibacillus TaxID=44249 RepID=A0A433Y843_9BACL|nr:M1 family metallopeptidase [Paenibacillus anaericanus]RUT45548.1 M1 family peptidase [Paenibacillus anaericanus]